MSNDGDMQYIYFGNNAHHSSSMSKGMPLNVYVKLNYIKPRNNFCMINYFKGRVGKNGETSSSALEFESMQPKKICPFLQTSLQSPSSNTHERAHDQ